MHANNSQKLILIGGTYKSGTKSLFEYLDFHKMVGACNTKEPSFFLPVSFGVKSGFSYEKNSVESYLELFQANDSHSHLVEATPSYLYSAKAAQMAKKCFPNVHAVFCLRDPIERLQSWHSMLKHLRLIPQDTGFKDYVLSMINGTSSETPEAVDFPYRGLAHGRYTTYIKDWFDAVGKSQCSIIWFDDLKNSPKTTIEKLCADIGLDASPYQQYTFERHNQAVHLRYWFLWSGYLKLKAALRKVFTPRMKNKPFLKKQFLRLEALYGSLINKPVEHPPLDQEIEATLINYYAPDVAALSALLGRTPPWGSRYLSGLS